MKKECSKCHNLKWYYDYYTDLTSPDKRLPTCRQCCQSHNEKWTTNFAGGIVSTTRGMVLKSLKLRLDGKFDIKCSRCKEWKHEDNFGLSVGRNVLNKDDRCKPCNVNRAAKWNKANPDKHSFNQRKSYRNKPEYQRNYNLQRYHGITQEQYVEKLSQQGGVCAICGTDQPGSHGKYFAQDHDHKTGANRDLLCSYCNIALGTLNDDISRFEKCIKYLQKWQNV